MCIRQNKFDIRQNNILRYAFILLWKGYFSHSGFQDYELSIDTEEKQIYSTLFFLSKALKILLGLLDLTLNEKLKFISFVPKPRGRHRLFIHVTVLLNVIHNLGETFALSLAEGVVISQTQPVALWPETDPKSGNYSS